MRAIFSMPVHMVNRKKTKILTEKLRISAQIDFNKGEEDACGPLLVYFTILLVQ